MVEFLAIGKPINTNRPLIRYREQFNSKSSLGISKRYAIGQFVTAVDSYYSVIAGITRFFTKAKLEVGMQGRIGDANFASQVLVLTAKNAPTLNLKAQVVMIGNLDYFKWISPDPEWLKHRVDAKGLENVDKTEFGLFIPQVVNAAQREITLAKNQRVNLEIWHAAKFPHGSYIFLNTEKLAGIDLGRAAKSVPNQPLILDMYIQFVADNYADKEWSKWRLHMESFETIRLESLH